MGGQNRGCRRVILNFSSCNGDPFISILFDLRPIGRILKLIVIRQGKHLSFSFLFTIRFSQESLIEQQVQRFATALEEAINRDYTKGEPFIHLREILVDLVLLY